MMMQMLGSLSMEVTHTDLKEQHTLLNSKTEKNNSPFLPITFSPTIMHYILEKINLTTDLTVN
jgi:hypothetical protein